MKMYLISDNVDTQTGMRLAGIEGVVVHEREELRQALETAFADKEIGIILLTEKFGREFPEVVNEARISQAASDHRDSGSSRHRPEAGFHHILYQRIHRPEIISIPRRR